MPGRIEDYAVIGNCETIALVGREGSIDWLCLPRFDSDACLSALLGSPEHGRWLIGPANGATSVTRGYRGDTLILETRFENDRGAVTVTDFMSRRDGCADLVRLVRGLRGQVDMQMELVVRFDYGSVTPWVTREEDGRLQLVAGPDRLLLDASVACEGEHYRTVADFSVDAGEEVSFVLTWSPSYRSEPKPIDIITTLGEVQTSWSEWSTAFDRSGRWADSVLRSLLTLKALAHWETGGIVAAGTTSLPER
ncbi:MAG: glycoside hydrolase family 15 protein, partial [Hyphomicrobiales bacterium]|nr:glycoside hydrolase family 15 protein [Hyphomicrobiales bacterium]